MSAYRLAICEDDALILTELKSICSDILTGDGIENEITVFHSAKALHSFLLSQSNPFDMLVLDIQMEDMTGMELAQVLRQRGDRVSIIFVTSCDDYQLEKDKIRRFHNQQIFLLFLCKKARLFQDNCNQGLNYIAQSML